MKLLRTLVLCFGFFFCAVQLFAQNHKQIDFINEIKGYDLSKIWAADSILSIWEEDNSVAQFPRSEPLGFIGDDYQRFYIKFISAIKVQDNPNEYLVYGKTRVKNNICTFQGTIKIETAFIYNTANRGLLKIGHVVCNVVLYEDMKQPGSGTIKGTLQTYFNINEHNQILYDGTDFASDGYCNNQFTGTWTSYKNGTTKKCHWGDYRIPDCGDLDIGAGEFSVNDKYIKNGWASYVDMTNRSYHSPMAQEARKEEERQWWKD